MQNTFELVQQLYKLLNNIKDETKRRLILEKIRQLEAPKTERSPSPSKPKSSGGYRRKQTRNKKRGSKRKSQKRFHR
jgi:hypothetical protein